MSEPIPESIPTSQDPRSKRPLKRRALTPVTQQASQVEALFAKPDRDIAIPSGALTPVTQQASQVEALFAKPDRDIAIPSGALTKKNNLQAPPEIVANVQGSSAGAGSGEFHVYKASRRREYERIKMMDEEVAKEKADEEFEKKREEMRRKDEEKTGKNRKRREKNKKKNKEGKEGAKDGGVDAKERGKDKMPRLTSDDEADGDAIPATTAEDIGIIVHDDD